MSDAASLPLALARGDADHIRVMEPTTRRPMLMEAVEYDAMRRRLWILGQRCHHGATGAVIATGALLGAAVGAMRSKRLATLAGAGTLLMAHDWKDRSIWFERGPGSQL